MSNNEGVITDRRQITARWLTRALREHGVLDRGRVVSLTVDRWRSKLLSDLLRVSVRYSPDAPPAAPPSLIVKVTKADRVSRRTTRRGWKENRFYVLVAPHMEGAPVPRCYDAAHDPERGLSHLVLEDLSESHDRPPHGLPPTKEQAEQDIECLASIHGRWWNDPRLGEALGLRDERWYERRVTASATIVGRFLDEVGARLSPAARTAITDVAAAFPTLLRRQAQADLTVAHGDAHCWNFLNPREPARGRACLLAWECWDIEPRTHDLAVLMGLHWYPDLRLALERPLLERYHRGLQAAGVDGYDWDACWTDYRFSVAERVMSPLYQWHRGRPVDSWWPNLARITAAYDDLGCADLVR